jgi:endonuclease/exonuclease/phosphatase family metal-dependent hydrolase
MENTLNVTTFNSLNNPARREERVEVLFQEIKEHDSDIVLLQEVLKDTFPILKAKAVQDGWHISEGARTTSPHNPLKISGNVTLSRSPIESQFILPCGLCEGKAHVPTLITHLENNVTVVNAHLPWGGTAELDRLDTAYQINQYAECLQEQEPDRLIVFGGDFNATPNSTVLRYLTGEFLYKETSTFWTNSWDMAEEVFPTARKEGGWAESTALGVGITRPEQMPSRTIDFVLTYGWNYGKKHCPLNLKKFGESKLSNGFGLSDHYGLTTQITV